MFKIFAAFIGVAALALGGAVLLLIWITSMTPIQDTDESIPAGDPPTAEEWIDMGAVLFAVGEVDAVYGAEWSSSDQSRPGTPWDVSDFPDDIWIHTPVIVDLAGPPVLIRPEMFEELETNPPEVDLLLALRGGEIGDDRYTVIDGQNRDFATGEQVALVLGVKDNDLDDPELIGTAHGTGWEFLGRYEIEDETAIIQWGDETVEYSLPDLVAEFRDASE
ncbi:MAG: hypothetical protein EA415_10255 [Sphaerobacteraceae bacterium]|nr:MAG: hypothetical protein EA415_10255 [Sphaerobacteraceae bacterium]